MQSATVTDTRCHKLRFLSGVQIRLKTHKASLFSAWRALSPLLWFLSFRDKKNTDDWSFTVTPIKTYKWKMRESWVEFIPRSSHKVETLVLSGALNPRWKASVYDMTDKTLENRCRHDDWLTVRQVMSGNSCRSHWAILPGMIDWKVWGGRRCLRAERKRNGMPVVQTPAINRDAYHKAPNPS